MRNFSLASLAAAALIAAIPSGASGATTIGDTFDPSVGGFCEEEGRTFLQSTSPATTPYTAPTDGVITRWSFRAPASGVDKLKFKVARPAGGDFFTMIGESALVDPAPDTLNSFFIQIPVKAGDVIGFYWDVANTARCSRSDGDYGYHFENGDVVPPTMEEFFHSDSNTQYDVSALLEPDCDKDGLGDETQDANLSSCAPPPPGTTPPPTGIPPPGSPPGTPPVTCRGLAATIVGTEGNDVRVGSLGRDVIAGLGGNDALSGIAGNDVICGGAGKDTLRGGKGKDTLLGQKGKDRLKGGGNKDFCKGGKGKDTASKCEVEKSI